MEMVHVLPRWPDMTTEVDIEGEALVTVVEAMAAEATEVVEAMAVVMVVAPTPIGEATVEVAEAIEVPAVAIEAVREETTVGEEATEDLGDSSEEGAEGAMGVATLGKEEGVVATKALLCGGLCIDSGQKMHATHFPKLFICC